MINSLNSVSSLSLYLMVGPVESCCKVSNTDLVNSGSYLRTVFVFISGITTFTGFAGGAAFLGSCFTTVGGGVTGLISGLFSGNFASVFLASVLGAGCL